MNESLSMNMLIKDDIKQLYFTPNFNLYYYNTPYVNEVYPSFTQIEPILDNYILSPLSPLSGSSSNAYFNDLEMMDVKDNFAMMSPPFEPFYDGYYNFSPNTFEPLLPTVKSNDIIYSNPSKRGNMKAFRENRPMIYQCDICGKVFDRKYVLKRHRGSHTNKREYYCKPCDMGFYRKDIYDRHLSTKKCMKAHKLT